MIYGNNYNGVLYINHLYLPTSTSINIEIVVKLRISSYE